MSRSQYTWQFTLFILLLCIAALMRMPAAVHPGLWADEIFSLAMATGHSLEHPPEDADPKLGDFVEPQSAEPASAFRRYMEHETPPAGASRVIRAVFLSDTSPPFYYLLLNVYTRITGTSDFALRLFSTVFALACLPLLWILGREVGGKKTAWATCLLFTFSPPGLYYSAEGRMYSLVWVLGLSLALCTFLLNRRGPRPHLLLLWCVTGAAGLLTHYFFAFCWLACFAWFWIHTNKVKRGVLVGLILMTGLVILPWYIQIPDSLSRWRVTAGWLDSQMTWQQLLAAPFNLASSLLGSRVPWSDFVWPDRIIVCLYAFLIVLLLYKRVWRLSSHGRSLIWLWVVASCLGPVLFDSLMHTRTSTVWRYALPGFPAAMLLAGFYISRLPPRGAVAFLMLILLTWLPGIRDVFAEPSRPWAYPEIGTRLAAWSTPSDLIIVHSIPSGVLGVSRYLETSTPLASWVVQLEQRHLPDDMNDLLDNRCRVAVVKVHDLGKPSPAEIWLQEYATLDHKEVVHQFTEILYFLPELPNGTSVTQCLRRSGSAPTVSATSAASRPINIE